MVVVAWGYVCRSVRISKPVVSRIEKEAMSLSVFKLFMPLFVSFIWMRDEQTPKDVCGEATLIG